MEFQFSKLLPIALFPVGAMLLATLFAIITGRRHPRFATSVLLLGSLYLGLAATPRVAQLVVASLERHHPPVPVAELPVADAIVLLGGGLFENGRADGDLNHAADRLWQAMRLWQAGKAPVMLVSGGPLHEDGFTEADRLAGRLIEVGVPDASIVRERESRNTRENAAFSAPLLAGIGARRVLLVTSATHMVRARAHFERAGVDVIPAATDHRAPLAGGWGRYPWLPQAWALEQTTAAIHEYLGLGWARLRGRL